MLKKVGTYGSSKDYGRMGATSQDHSSEVVVGEKLIACNGVVKSWNEEVKEATRIRREGHARYVSRKSTLG